MPYAQLKMFGENGIWVKPPRLYAVEFVCRGAGGGGSLLAGTGAGHGGGGGSATRSLRRVLASDLPEALEVVVGHGGTGGRPGGDRNGTDGGKSQFGDFIAAGGGTGATTSGPGVGGIGSFVGANGGVGGQRGWDAVSSKRDMFSGGAGGGGGGQPGGSAGWRFPGEGVPTAGNNGIGWRTWWQVLSSGCGGGGATSSTSGMAGAGGFPAGGGGGGNGSVPAGNGGNGCVTVIEYMYDDEG